MPILSGLGFSNEGGGAYADVAKRPYSRNRPSSLDFTVRETGAHGYTGAYAGGYDNVRVITYTHMYIHKYINVAMK